MEIDSQAKASYVKVSDEQRELLIDLMEQNNGITLKEACKLVKLNYENAKVIWKVYKSSGRKHNIRV